MDLLGADVYVPAEGGHFVSEKHAQIAELINEYDPTLELAWIPPDRREPGDKPFAVVHRPLGQPEYVVCYADDCDERLLARVFAMDNAHGNVLDAVEANNAAVRALQLKKEIEQREEAMDLTRSIIGSKKHVYRHNGVRYE